MSRSLLINQSIGEYRIESFLGAGGMGEVYRASHSKIGRLAAVKVLTSATQEGGGFVERFFNEARIQASLQHPNIATLYDFCEVAGQPCIIMEYVDGLTVAERIAAHGAPLPPSETARVFEKVVEAIEHIHRHGIIHRDIKSNNIKVSSSGQVKLLDFGIAKGQTSPGLTQVGSVIGTIQYLAPELICGGTADGRVDIWALGVLLYEMVTGRVPFDADSLGELCDQIKRARYVAPAQLNPAVRPEVARVIERCLKENPAERYQSAGDLLRDARRLATAPPPHSRPDETASEESSERETEKTGAAKTIPLIAAAAVVVVLGIVGLVALFVLTSTPAGAPEPAAAKTAVPQGAARSAPADAEERAVELQVSDGRAEVYRDGKLLGTTPYNLKARVGEHVRLTLRRPGYTDEPVAFTVSEKKSYTFSMSK
ncbi:MAG TPA: serine/threonine-protein kinase [Pyrinomonadaceae bacterium]